MKGITVISIAVVFVLVVLVGSSPLEEKKEASFQPSYYAMVGEEYAPI